MQDMGQSLSDLFSSFDPKPLGVASLAQVHKAVLKETGEEVAVKFQHPRLDKYTHIDIDGVDFLVKLVKWAIPEFELAWLADEMKRSLPRELDFRVEADNARQVDRNFQGTHLLAIPKIVWDNRRILCMEFMTGARIDDLDYMHKHDIDPAQVSKTISKAFYEMIFHHGFVHCDPHPGNIFIRPRIQRWYQKLFFPSRTENFDVVLLDHGLYRSLSDSLRLDYARLWLALIDGDEADIEKHAFKLFQKDNRVSVQKHANIEYHRLFASMLTSRTWEVISSRQGMSGLAMERSPDEMVTIQTKVSGENFIIAISEILAALPSEVLLLLKTNDLLRAVDHSLGVDSTKHFLSSIAMMASYCARAVRQHELQVFRDGKFSLLSFLVRYLGVELAFVQASIRVWLMRMVLFFM